MMTIGSLFAGIGGLELGLELAGLGPVVWQAESDRYCRGILAKHWPDARRYERVEDIDESAERVDIICGGFPCQDISSAGLGKGLAGERSGLWREFARILRVLRPRFAVVENVSALLGRGMGVVLGDLATSGFDAAWDCIPAAAIGAPHRRDRLFLVAWRVPDADSDKLRDRPERGDSASRPTDEGHPFPVDVGSHVADTDGARSQRRVVDGARFGSPVRGEAMADTISERLQETESARERQRDFGKRIAEVLADPNGWRREIKRIARRQLTRGHKLDGRDLPPWPPASGDVRAWREMPAAAQPAVCRLAHGLPDRVARLRATGNAVVPAVGEVIGELILRTEAM